MSFGFDIPEGSYVPPQPMQPATEEGNRSQDICKTISKIVGPIICTLGALIIGAGIVAAFVTAIIPSPIVIAGLPLMLLGIAVGGLLIGLGESIVTNAEESNFQGGGWDPNWGDPHRF